MIQTVSNLHVVALSQDNKTIYVDLIQSLAANHIAQQPHILALAKELLSKRPLNGETIEIEHDFGRPIGNSDIVTTTDKDTVVYAKFIKSDTFSRFVRRRQLTTSQFLSISLRRMPDGAYELLDVCVGKTAPPFPTKESSTEASLDYWSNHAIIIEGQPLQFRTFTKDAPY